MTHPARASLAWSTGAFTWPWIAAVLLAAFLLRMALSVRFYWDDDARQVYLIGLKWFTTGEWPYFGPDVVYTQSQIPGALQGVLVGGPLFLVPHPVSPLVLVNLISIAALALLAWYICRRLPGLPVWFVWLWTLLAPWGLFRAVRTMNPDYVLAGAILVFVGLFETIPALRKGVIPRGVAGAMMGFGIGWIMQLHLSWPVLVPLMAYALFMTYRQAREGLGPTVAGLAIGAAIPAAFLVPTYLEYGLFGGMGGTQQNVQVHGGNPVTLFFTLVGRFLSFASYDLPYWTGGGTFGRAGFYQRQPWAFPAAALLLVMSFAVPAVLVIEGFRKKNHPEWPVVRAITGATIMILYLAFLFSVRGPSTHTFYLVFPLVMLYSMYCWEPFLVKRRWRRLAAACLIAALWVTIALLFEHHPERSFAADREAAAQAIEAGDYRLLGERRATEWGCCY